ncbi:hypothetical protein [Halorussus caseinilyticus]|uniref:hypothetical protein n=1 Tax=Halorussus caseinilyticus TaxID=3034025 RepID=UPI0023E78160|nr:hypothetical protein [Halorussus sp. DT72]
MKKLPTAVLAAFAVGLVVGATAWAGFGGAVAPTDSGPDPESPPYSLSTAGGNCLDVRAHAGWVHEVAVGDSFAVTLNATVVHERGQTVEAEVNRGVAGRYRIDLRTVADGRESANGTAKKSPLEGCRVATDLRLAASLPTDYSDFEIAVNGRTLLTVENEDTAADLYQFPNPVNATNSPN